MSLNCAFCLSFISLPDYLGRSHNNNNNNNMQILIKRIKHPTDTAMRCCLLLRYQEYCHNHFASPRTCYWPSAHPIST